MSQYQTYGDWIHTFESQNPSVFKSLSSIELMEIESDAAPSLNFSYQITIRFQSQKPATTVLNGPRAHSKDVALALAFESYLKTIENSDRIDLPTAPWLIPSYAPQKKRLETVQLMLAKIEPMTLNEVYTWFRRIRRTIPQDDWNEQPSLDEFTYTFSYRGSSFGPWTISEPEKSDARKILALKAFIELK